MSNRFFTPAVTLTALMGLPVNDKSIEVRNSIALFWFSE